MNGRKLHCGKPEITLPGITHPSPDNEKVIN